MINNIATIKIIDEIHVLILGLRVQDYNHFYNKFGFYDDGYFFKPQYKLGKWDGKIRLFSKEGLTTIHFIESIIKDLNDFGYKIKLIDNRNPISFDVPLIQYDSFSKFNIKLEDHQVKCINSLIANRGGIAIAATGAGKSYIIGALMSHLYDYMKLKTIVIVPTADLVLQTAAEVKLFGNDTGMFFATTKELNKTHLVSTWQSLQNNPEILHGFNCIIVDEAHGAKGKVLKSMIEKYGAHSIFICGVTGTLPKHESDVMQIKYVLGEVQETITADTLIKKGWLSNLLINQYQLEEDFKDKYKIWKEQFPNDPLKYESFKTNYFPDYQSEKQWTISNEKRIKFIAELISVQTEKTGNSFILVNSVKVGKKLQKLIPNSYFIDSVTDDNKVRKKIYDLYSTNDNVIAIATFHLASTGLNIKRIFNLFFIDPGSSFIRTIQSIGRGLRTAADKNFVTVWDIYSDLKYAKKHSKERLKFYKEQKYNSIHKIIKYHDLYDNTIDNNSNIVVY